MEVTFDISGQTFDEKHVIILIAPGDVDFGDNILTVVTADDVKTGIETTLTDTQLQDIIVEVAELTKGYLEACGVDTSALTSIPLLVQSAIKYGSRATVLQRDLGAGRSVNSLREGNKTIKFSSGQDSEAQSGFYWDFWERNLLRYCTVAGQGEHRLKSVNKKKWQNVLGNSRFTYGTDQQRRRK